MIEAHFASDIGNPDRTDQGTEFIVKNKNDELCFITNRHVIDRNYANPGDNYKLNKLIIHGKKLDSSGEPALIDQSFQIINIQSIATPKDDANDVACIKNVDGVNLNEPSKKFIAEYFIPYEVIATHSDFHKKLNVCDFLAFPGFPPWYYKVNKRPIFRAGVLSSDPRFNYRYQENGVTVSGESLAYEAFSYGGSSGSPIFAVEKGLRPGKGISLPGYRELLLIGINAAR